MNLNRVRELKKGNIKKGTILYWMSREQRIEDNWALIFAQKLATENSCNLVIAFCLTPTFLGATIRHYRFMIEGLKEVEEKAKLLNIPFLLLPDSPDKILPGFIAENNIAAMVCDFDPLKIKRIWKREVVLPLEIPVYEVDAHNVVPALYVSQKEEFAAYTIRPKITKLLPEFLDNFPVLAEMPLSNLSLERSTDWEALYNSLIVDREVKEVTSFKPGSNAGLEVLSSFLTSKTNGYAVRRNNPNFDAQSDLSPYLHFGQISAQRVALAAEQVGFEKESKESFLEELIVRRELADNFCYFNKNYDSFEGFKDWAKQSLNAHRDDKRDFIYSLEDFESKKTHDSLWNAAQNEMMVKGKMHGFMRMYWAKKILEWTITPEEALKIAIYLNDKYELDGRDPNGYTGCAWSIGGIHDRAWFDRPVYGKIRYMNYNGCKSKFDVNEYIRNNK